MLALHVVLMVSLAMLFTPLFTLGLGALPPHLYSHGSSLLGTLQQVAGAVGTALAVTVMSVRTGSLVAAGGDAGAAAVEGVRWAFGTSAVVGAPYEVPCRAALVTASRTAGCAWPSSIGPHEQIRST